MRDNTMRYSHLCVKVLSRTVFSPWAMKPFLLFRNSLNVPRTHYSLWTVLLRSLSFSRNWVAVGGAWYISSKRYDYLLFIMQNSAVTMTYTSIFGEGVKVIQGSKAWENDGETQEPEPRSPDQHMWWRMTNLFFYKGCVYVKLLKCTKMSSAFCDHPGCSEG